MPAFFFFFCAQRIICCLCAFFYSGQRKRTNGQWQGCEGKYKKFFGVHRFSFHCSPVNSKSSFNTMASGRPGPSEWLAGRTLVRFSMLVFLWGGNWNAIPISAVVWIGCRIKLSKNKASPSVLVSGWLFAAPCSYKSLKSAMVAMFNWPYQIYLDNNDFFIKNIERYFWTAAICRKWFCTSVKSYA